jgi:hypothetical protein
MATSPTPIKDLFDSVPGVKTDWKEDWKEDAIADWKEDWVPPAPPASPAS